MTFKTTTNLTCRVKGCGATLSLSWDLPYDPVDTKGCISIRIEVGIREAARLFGWLPDDPRCPRCASGFAPGENA